MAALSDMDGAVSAPKKDKLAAVRGVLQQNRQFLDFFWDIAKPDQEVRLKATEDLIEYLKASEKVSPAKRRHFWWGLGAVGTSANTCFGSILCMAMSLFLVSD